MFELVGGHVHVVYLILGHYREVSLVTAADALVEDVSFVIEVDVGLCDHLVLLFLSAHVDASLGGHVHLAVLYLSIRCLDKSEIVDPRVHAERGDQADIGSLRGLDGAEAAVMGVVHVAHLESGTVP